MARPTKNTFLERAGYRRRRMRDVARVLPVLIGILFCIPLLWDRNGELGTADALIYLFTVWFCALGISAGIARFLATDRSDDR
ncbi:hypothetical protein B9057_10105 [Aestuarium zhoushanense]|nr:hypothetical protein B9057_10105 [Aestuarium zhoushanense]